MEARKTSGPKEVIVISNQRYKQKYNPSYHGPNREHCIYPAVMPVCALAEGRAIAQAVSRWLLTAAARVRSRVWSSEICGGQSGAVAGFLRVLRFPLPIFIPS
jgi:hypothetical protein